MINAFLNGAIEGTIWSIVGILTLGVLEALAASWQAQPIPVMASILPLPPLPPLGSPLPPLGRPAPDRPEPASLPSPGDRPEPNPQPEPASPEPEPAAIAVGDRIMRQRGKDEKGTVLELSDGKARIAWDGYPGLDQTMAQNRPKRTWIGVNVLKKVTE